MMISDALYGRIEPWIHHFLGIPFSALQPYPVPVLSTVTPDADSWILSVANGGKSAVMAPPIIATDLEPIVANLNSDMIFSSFGCYELARALLPHGFTPFGPQLFMFGDEETVPRKTDDRPIEMTDSQRAAVDYRQFWHCVPDAVTSFGVYDSGRLLAMASIGNHAPPLLEIGMEVAIDVKGRGLGRAVVNAAAQWILGNSRIPFATVGHFNIPSARTRRANGLRYGFQTIDAKKGPFKIPPQSLGTPASGFEVHDYYPRWAMNQDVIPRTDLEWQTSE